MATEKLLAIDAKAAAQNLENTIMKMIEILIILLFFSGILIGGADCNPPFWPWLNLLGGALIALAGFIALKCNISDDTPSPGRLRIERDSDNNIQLVEYSSHNGDDEFTIRE